MPNGVATSGRPGRLRGWRADSPARSIVGGHRGRAWPARVRGCMSARPASRGSAASGTGSSRQGRHRIAGQAEHARRRRAGRTSAACPAASRSSRIERHALGVSTAWTRSWSPTEAPPSVTMTSALGVARAARMPATVSSRGRGTMPRSTTSAPSPRDQRAQRHSRWRRRSGRGRACCPAAAVRRRSRSMATSGRRCTGSVGWFTAAASDSAAAIEEAALAQEHVALLEIEPGARGCGGRRRPASITSIASPSRVGILLDEDGVGAVRHRRAGEDAHGLARADGAAERRAGRASPITLSVAPTRRRRRRAPHSRPSPTRRRAAACAAPRRRAASTRPGASASATVSAASGATPASSASSASSTGSQGHGATPSPGSRPTCRRVFSTSRMPEITMPRSTALAMS